MPRCKCCGCDNLIKAINAYLAKADDDLEEQLGNEGYVDAEDSVSAMTSMEEGITAALVNQTDEIVKKLKRAKSLEEAKRTINEYFADDTKTSEELTEVFEEFYGNNVQTFASSYMKETSGDLVVSQLRQRTTAWISEWSSKLSEMMQLTSQDQIGSLIEAAIKDGKGVADLTRKLMEEGIRNEEWRARRAAMTEMLRAHSVARSESIAQDPSVTQRKWVHTGAYRTAPRQNHVDMDGTVVDKEKPYTLLGADGELYYPMFPRDPNLPASESVNCHCIEEAIADADILGLSLEERQALQQQYIEEDDGEWEKELDARNKAKAGIEE